MVTIPDHLLPTTFPLAEYVRTVRAIKVKQGTTVEMVLDPDFYKHGAGGLKVDDHIEITAQDGSFFIVVRVLAVDMRGNWAHVELINPMPGVSSKNVQKPEIKSRPDEEGYLIEWSQSPVHRWRIVDRAGDVVESRMPTREKAEERLAQIKREKIAA